MNRVLNIHSPNQWDMGASFLLNSIQPSKFNIFNFATLFSIDALNLTIDKDKEQDEMVILDIAAGFGTLSLYGCNKLKNSKFISSDFSPKFIQVLDKFINELDIKNIESKVMDGQNLLEIKDSTIDYTYSMFGLIFFPDLFKGIQEMYRVLKPGGKTAIGSWCSNAFLPSVFQKTMDELLGEVGKFKIAALSLSDSTIFENKLKEAGFKNIQIIQVQHPMEVNELEDLIKHLSINPIYQDCIAELSDEKKQLFNETFIKISKYQLGNQNRNENGKLELQSYAYIGIGQK